MKKQSSKQNVTADKAPSLHERLAVTRVRAAAEQFERLGEAWAEEQRREDWQRRSDAADVAACRVVGAEGGSSALDGAVYVYNRRTYTPPEGQDKQRILAPPRELKVGVLKCGLFDTDYCFQNGKINLTKARKQVAQETGWPPSTVKMHTQDLQGLSREELRALLDRLDPKAGAEAAAADAEVIAVARKNPEIKITKAAYRQEVQKSKSKTDAIIAAARRQNEADEKKRQAKR